MEQSDKKISNPGSYLIVWLALMLLTVLTVVVAESGLGKHGALVSVAIAFMKSGLILFFFMHLKDEKYLIKVMLLLAVFTVAVIIGLTFSDIWFRY